MVRANGKYDDMNKAKFGKYCNENKERHQG